MSRTPMPPHLAHKSTLAIVLTEKDSPKAYDLVQSVRQVHDKSYQRWPPHINLLYPFLAQPTTQMDTIVERVQAAIQDIPAFQATFPELHHFVHSKKSATLFLQSEPSSTAVQMQQLQAALQAAFPECNYDTRPFVPHMTLGQARGEDAVHNLAHDVNASIEASFGPERTIEWTVSRVVIMERKGNDDPFEIVGEVALKA
ncbi:hypothetical protein LEN26_009315 [Aphanomyces euteiches]|nr:hypothetical protein LEN26_009315 [Aphanomyces euteiches]KAH9158820.1 hypothetical protein AeNC1_019135 [Aphanomyces euteiches]